jgi:hypothetical protein
MFTITPLRYSHEINSKMMYRNGSMVTGSGIQKFFGMALALYGVE